MISHLHFPSLVVFISCTLGYQSLEPLFLPPFSPARVCSCVSNHNRTFIYTTTTNHNTYTHIHLCHIVYVRYAVSFIQELFFHKKVV
ncbi:hypothetical protein CPB86DRAFT_364199 [Serendipita vermifera]|nr:hypothetical protein CPB86DRAFT_364199 [Serendipita vermifera]